MSKTKEEIAEFVQRIEEIAATFRQLQSEVKEEDGIDDCVLALAKDMQFKLNKNKHKECATMNPDVKGRGWKHCDIIWLKERAKGEIIELEDEILAGNWEEARLECADVANFMMMVHDILTERIERFKKGFKTLKEANPK